MNHLISGPRVHLRELRPEDWKAVHAYAGDPEVVRYQAWGPHTERDSIDWVELAIRESLKRPRSMYYLGICLNASGELIGGVGIDLLSPHVAHGTAELGYSLARWHWGRGLGPEAAALALDFLFAERADVRRVVAHCRVVNEASIRLLERLGFRREGRFVADVEVRGVPMDSYWYGMLREEWRQAGGARIEPGAWVSRSATVGKGTWIGAATQVHDGAVIGEECRLHKNVFVGARVRIGSRVKIQNDVSLFEGVTLEDGVFVGPHACFSNDKVPRSVNPDGTPKTPADWSVTSTRVGHGASIGANATIVCGVKIGPWAMIGAGAVVTQDVPPHALVLGNPARIAGYVCRCGARLAGEVAASDGFCTRCIGRAPRPITPARS